MKATKRLLAAILSIVMMICAVPFSVGAVDTLTTADGFEYTVDTEKGEVTVTKYKGTASVVIVPAEIDGYPVVHIGNRAFAFCWNLTAVDVPESVTSLGTDVFRGCDGITEFVWPDQIAVIPDNAFYDCSNLKSIIIPDTVTHIGSSAFFACYDLTSLDIPESVTSIGSDAFRLCSSLTEFIWPDQITKIPNNCFYDCYSLKNIVIPGTVTEIGNYAFEACRSLVDVNIPHSVTTIGNGVFWGCDALAEICYMGSKTQWLSVNVGDQNDVLKSKLVIEGDKKYKGVLYDLDFEQRIVTVTGYDGEDPSVVIPSVIEGLPVVYIAEYAFNKNTFIKEVTLPESITTIGQNAFTNCENLETVNFAEGLETIGISAFYGCSSLGNVSLPESLRIIKSQAFAFCSSFTEFHIPAKVENIALGQKYSIVNIIAGCNSLEKITVDENNEYYSSANNCIIDTATKTLIAGTSNSTIPDDGSVTSIADLAFAYCDGIDTIVIPPAITTIGNFAFKHCGIVTMEIPLTVTKLGESIFYGCEILESVTYLGTRVQWLSMDRAFPNKALLDKLTIEGDKKYSDFQYELDETFENATITAYVGDGEVFEIPSHIDGIPVTAIGERCFQYNTTLKKVTVPETVKSIDHIAFYMCENIETVELSEGLETIGDGAFRNCDKIKEIVLPDSLKYIESNAFMGCHALTSLNIPKNVEYIGTGDEDEFSIIAGCKNLTSLTVDKDNKYYEASGNCLIEKSTKILIAGTNSSVIPADGSVIAIGNNAFSCCNGLTEIVIPDTVVTIGARAFDQCFELKNVVMSEKIAVICAYAFRECPIESITLTRRLTNIFKAAFYRCENLKVVYYLGNASEWQNTDIASSNDYLKNANIVFLGDGDIDDDGEASPADCLLFKKLLSRIIDEDSIRTDRGDLNGDGDINAKDQLLLRRKLAN